MAKSVTVLGSTGVIGQHTLDVVSSLGDSFEVVSLAAGRNVERLAQQVRTFRPKYVCLQDETSLAALRDLLSDLSVKPDFGFGDHGLVEAAEVPSDIVVSGIMGARGMLAAWKAIERGAVLALANKETLVAAGDLVMPFARSRSVPIIPVDSEHSALYQCLLAGEAAEVARYIVTASGGPFRSYTLPQMAHIDVQAALSHPNWVMGKKITVDSATMMNKGLEVIEAHHLFSAPYDKIDVLVHPQSIVHSMIEYVDGSVLAQLGAPDMRLPIQYALTHPKRMSGPSSRLRLDQLSQLTFELPDMERFPALRLAYEAGSAGGYAPCVLNAANEVAVDSFLDGGLSFLGIARLVERVLDVHPVGNPGDLGDIIEMDLWARDKAGSLLAKGGW